MFQYGSSRPTGSVTRSEIPTNLPRSLTRLMAGSRIFERIEAEDHAVGPGLDERLDPGTTDRSSSGALQTACSCAFAEPSPGRGRKACSAHNGRRRHRGETARCTARRADLGGQVGEIGRPERRGTFQHAVTSKRENVDRQEVVDRLLNVGRVLVEAHRFRRDLAQPGARDELGERLAQVARDGSDPGDCPESSVGTLQIAVSGAIGTRGIGGQAFQPRHAFHCPRLLKLADERTGAIRRIAFHRQKFGRRAKLRQLPLRALARESERAIVE